jgi:hypothetical protein
MSTQRSRATDQSIEECLKNCVDCHRICVETIDYCLRVGGSHAGAPHAGVLIDCEKICQTSADFLIRRSDLHPGTCAACAEACNACADSCDRFPGDRQMKACADLCRVCARSCEQLAAMA